MAQIKTPYGLVYNTNGSLCATYRDDDIPFPGVRSFAVERETTNLITNYNITTWTKHGETDTYYELTDEEYKGCPVIKLGKPNEDRSENGRVAREFFIDFWNLPDGTKYTFSIYVFIIEAGSSFNHTRYRNCINFYPNNLGETPIWFEDLPKNQWIQISITGTIMDTLRARPIICFDNSYIKVACPQFEEAPFATSFVDGNRPKGWLQLVNDMFDKNNLVIAQWVKHIVDTTIMWSGTEVGSWSADNSLFYATFGLRPSNNQIILRYNGTSNTKVVSIDDIVKKWVLEIFILDGQMATYKIIGDNINETLTAITTEDRPFEGRIFIYSHTKTTHNFGLVANQYVGKYRKPNGDIIWTDDYIREVYEAQIPFPVSNKLSIY